MGGGAVMSFISTLGGGTQQTSSVKSHGRRFNSVILRVLLLSLQRVLNVCVGLNCLKVNLPVWVYQTCQVSGLP